MKLVVVDSSQLRIEGTRSELISLGAELLRCAEIPEHDFDPRDSCSPKCFEFDERLGAGFLRECVFVRVEEEPPRQSALERTPHEALDAG